MSDLLFMQFWQAEATNLRQQLHNLQENHMYDPRPHLKYNETVELHQ
jgi:hypothetical protein